MHAAPSTIADPGRFTPTVERNSLVVESVLSLAIVLIGIKFGKAVCEFYFDNPGAALRILRNSWLLRIALGTTLAFTVGRAFSPRWKWAIAASPLILLVPAKLIQALLRRTPSLAYDWVPEVSRQLWGLLVLATDLFRRDVLFLCCFAVVVYIAANVIPAKHLGAVRIATRSCVVLLLLISGIELASYYKLGVTGSGHLLAFFLTNAASLWPMLKPEIGVASVAALCVPLAAGLATMLLVSRWFARRPERPVRQLGRMWPAAMILSIGAGFTHAPRVDHRFDRFVDNTYLALGDILPWHRTAQIEAVKRAEQLPPLFDTSRAIVRPGSGMPAKRRNVIIVMLESARAGATSVADPALGSTPFLAEFAKKSAIVPEMHAVIPRTSAAWVAILDGIWPSTDEDMGAWVQNKSSQPESLPMLLSSQGYRSAYITSAHLTFGYDTALIQKEHFDEVFDADSLPSQGFDHPIFWGYEDRIMVQPSLDWVKQQRDKQNPFLLVMMTTVGHYDYRYPSSWKARDFGVRDENYNRYLNCLGYVDSVMKDFVEGLDKLGVLQSSIVIILGDHGESFGEHGATAHSLDLYDETLRIPAIIHADGLLSGGTAIPGLRQEVDVLPTVVDALGLTAENATFSGTSMLKPVSTDHTLYFSGALYSQSTALRSGNLKYIYNFGRTPTEVYAMDQDPYERHDIAATLPHSAIEQSEMDMLVWRERVSRAYAVSPSSK